MFGFRPKISAERAAFLDALLDESTAPTFANTSADVYRTNSFADIDADFMVDELARLRKWHDLAVGEMEKLGMRQTLSVKDFDTVLSQMTRDMEEQFKRENAAFMTKERTNRKVAAKQNTSNAQLERLIEQVQALQAQVQHSGLGARALDAAIEHPFIAGFLGEAAGPAILKKLTGR